MSDFPGGFRGGKVPEIACDKIENGIYRRCLMAEIAMEKGFIPTWVDVDLWLPHIDEPVLIYARGRDGEDFVMLVTFRGADGNWRTPTKNFTEHYEITHWMWLPKTPKELIRCQT